MSETKFTPGPWIADIDDHIVAPDGQDIALAGRFLNGERKWDEQADANAYLIAAAPELYEALDALVNEPTNAPDYLPSRLWDNARKALRKARGEA